MADAHTRLYRTMTIIGSMDDNATKAFRTEQGRTLGALAAQFDAAGKLPSGCPDRAALGRPGQLVKKYDKTADSAIDPATVDPEHRRGGRKRCRRGLQGPWPP
ncbi:MAG: hypothetical protein IPP44_07875 [Ideonella sp.]|nr:hypothetical protein [Ideonella sp.]